MRINAISLCDIFPSGCMLEAGKEVVFNPEDDDFEHQLDLRMVSTLRSEALKRGHQYSNAYITHLNFT